MQAAQLLPTLLLALGALAPAGPCQDPEGARRAETAGGSESATGPGASEDRQDSIPDELRAFAERVRARHWTEPRDEPVDRFAAQLLILPTAKDQNRIQVELQARFVMPRFLRFKLKRTKEDVVEGGIDQRGAWAREGDRLTDLERGERARDYVDQRRATRNYARLAAQLLQFLDPAGTLLRLQDAQAPEASQFRLSKFKQDALVVVGRMDRFPLFSPTNPDRTRPPVQLTLWFTPDDAELFAVRAQPLDAEGNISAEEPAEMVLLREFRETGGLRLPSELRFYRMGFAPDSLATIEISTIDPDPDITPELLGRDVKGR